jgi:hypothetical protein
VDRHRSIGLLLDDRAAFLGVAIRGTVVENRLFHVAILSGISPFVAA